MTQLFPLGSTWQFKARDPKTDLIDDLACPDGWLSASVPGTVHGDLLAAGRIPDPNDGLNELDVQWVGERDWLYRLDFGAPELAAGHLADLCFDGLDTFARVWLNGELILESDNMFVPRRVPVVDKLRPGRNELRVLFESALRRGREIEAERGTLPLWNGDSSRLYVRKAQYHYGWDWGPTLLTAGLWRDVRLEVYETRVAELACPVEVNEALSLARFAVQVELAGQLDSRVQLDLLGPDGHVMDSAELPAAQEIAHTFEVKRPALWWPAGHGAQPLYTVRAQVMRGGQLLDGRQLRVGARRLRLVQEEVEGEPGRSFLFEVNGVQLFCGGANWIPDDNLLPRVTRERYRARLTQARDAHMIMLRVWGGGVYEDDAFYDACDELGLLVWQDFMFACGLYPAHPEFLASVRAEAEAAVRRLRHHPCLALWCGNNEDYQVAQSVGAYGPGAEAGRFPALAIYEELLPEVCARLDPARPYWPSSPYGGEDPNDPAAGDRHTWNVWHGQMAPYQDYPQHEGRFVTEFGMQALPSLALIASVTPPGERFPASRTLEHHNKAADGPRRLNVYIGDTVPIPSDLPSYVYASQLTQAEALLSAYRGWRRRWGTPGKRAVAGALVWQLNDCWPVTSWAIIDSSGQPKPAYSAVKRALSPITVGLAREENGAAVWGVNGTLEAQTLSLELRALTLEGRELAREAREVTLARNAVTELGAFGVPDDEPTILAATLSRDGNVLAREALWPEPLKYLHPSDPGLSVERLGQDGVRLRAARPVKGVWLDAGLGVTWDDNLLDLLPGEERVVRAGGLGDSPLSVRWLGAPGAIEDAATESP